ncbi:MAG: IS481 family transposase [Bauldia sp.]|nr:IS481 family transposase [Bauldia sp.]
MNSHKNARMTLLGRVLLVDRVRQGWLVAAAAAAAGVSERTAYKWLARHRSGGTAALQDRSSAPGPSARRLAPSLLVEIERQRRLRLTGPAIAYALGLPRSTVGAVLRRLGLGRLAALEPKAPIVRYQRDLPGELIHIDTKKLGRFHGVGHRVTGHHTGVNRSRGSGWEVLHVAIDDASRLAYTELMPDEKKESACAFLDRAIGFFLAHGAAVQRVMTDNGSAYRSHAFRKRLIDAGLRHIRTRPYTPRTNGKAERFIQTSLREWAYARPFPSSAERGLALAPWIHAYNTRRPHSAIANQTPWLRLNNLLGNDS